MLKSISYYSLLFIVFLGFFSRADIWITDANKPVKLNKEIAMKVCNKMRSTLDVRGRMIVCKYSDSLSVNAHADITNEGPVIVIYQGMIDFVESEDELSVVIGHEISHHLLGHTELPKILGRHPYNMALGVYVDHQYFEAMADLLGMQLASTSGYDACKGKDLWSRMVKMYGHSYYGSNTHPNTLARIYNFDQYCNR